MGKKSLYKFVGTAKELNADLKQRVREQFLADYLATENDVLIDDEGREFIFTDYENGTSGEVGYGGATITKAYLPTWKK